MAKADSSDVAIWIASGLTVVWLAITGAFLYFRWSQAVAMPPNEWGDFLAGFFAPLAFVWLALGYFLQRRQLMATLLAFQEEKAAVDEDRNWRVATASPRLGFRSSGASYGAERISRSFVVTNFGGHAVKLVLNVDSFPGPIGAWDACGQGESFAFNFEVANTPRRYPATISMTDVLGNHHRCSFALVVDENGNVQLDDVRTEPVV